MGWKSIIDEDKAIHIATIMRYLLESGRGDAAEREFMKQTYSDAIKERMETENEDEIDAMCEPWDNQVDTNSRLQAVSRKIRDSFF